jgi:uncharacterized protein (TIGR03067 family)
MRVSGLVGVLALGFVVGSVAVAEEKDKLDPAALVGTWTYVSGERDGKKIDADMLKKGTVEITKETITLKGEDAKFVIKYSLDAAKAPAQVKMEITEGPMGVGAKAIGIISLKGDELKLCYPAMGGDEAPKEFNAKADSGLHLFVLKKKK